MMVGSGSGTPRMRVSVRKTATLSFLVVIALALVFGGCRGRGAAASNSGAPSTATIAPAAAKPDTSGTEVMTQTVDIGDSRSEAEGGITTQVPANNTSKTPPHPATRPVKKTKK
jgi:hypothetical protein